MSNLPPPAAQASITADPRSISDRDEGQARAHAAPAQRKANGPLARAALLAFILSPLVIFTLLCVLIWLSLRSGPMMNEPPRGAGAGQTGMYNQHMQRDR